MPKESRKVNCWWLSVSLVHQACYMTAVVGPRKENYFVSGAGLISHWCIKAVGAEGVHKYT